LASGLVLLTGASGFVGRRLGKALVRDGYAVRAMTRNPDDYRGPGEPIFGDALEPETLRAALDGCSTAYYLIHSLSSPDFARLDTAAARAFGKAAGDAGLRQIIYLGGLGNDFDTLSPHLRSRRQVEGLLGEGGVPVTVLRAGIVIGDQGLSWEITRQLVEHLPAMITPRWVRTRTQPIAVDDLICYLVGVLGHPDALGRVFEVGGPDILRYSTMLKRVAKIERRPLPIIPVPLLSPRLSSLWLSLVTDVDTQAGRTLVDSMTTEVIVRDKSIHEIVPMRLTSYDDAVRQALNEREKRNRR
jgi:uncharacterized protein YbjT (DUF2867 family)